MNGQGILYLSALIEAALIDEQDLTPLSKALHQSCVWVKFPGSSFLKLSMYRSDIVPDCQGEILIKVHGTNDRKGFYEHSDGMIKILNVTSSTAYREI